MKQTVLESSLQSSALTILHYSFIFLLYSSYHSLSLSKKKNLKYIKCELPATRKVKVQSVPFI